MPRELMVEHVGGAQATGNDAALLSNKRYPREIRGDWAVFCRPGPPLAVPSRHDLGTGTVV